MTVRRVFRPFRNLALGLLTLALFPFMLLSTLAAMLLTVGALSLVFVPMGLLFLTLAALAVIVWALVMVPSLVVCGDFSWPCTAAKWITAPSDRLSDWCIESERLDRCMDLPMEAMDAIWSAYGRLASRVEGCS